MDFEEYVKRFKEEFKKVEDLYDRPLYREMLLMYINNVILMEYQKEEMIKEFKKQRSVY